MHCAANEPLTTPIAANNLITNHSLPEEEATVASVHSSLTQNKSLPPGVFRTSNLRSSGSSLYYGDSAASSVHHQAQQQVGIVFGQFHNVSLIFIKSSRNLSLKSFGDKIVR